MYEKHDSLMNNFQLYRTNLLLGGQMKWDIVVDSDSNQLYVSDFHLSPISSNASYVHKTEESLLNNSHQDNVKTYYTISKGSFYNEALNADFSHKWPIICKEGEIVDAYSNIYDMGCRRSHRYDRYEKQFEFFCPLWIEHMNDELSFKITIKTSDTNNILAANTLKLSLNGIMQHDKFVNYFNRYISDSGLKEGSDEVMNLRFKTNTATVHGLNAATGLFETLSVNDIVTNIMLRERPMMETDNLLIQSFADNSMICKQLFNFNLCFNIDDILSGGITNMMLGETVIVTVDVLIGEDLLERRDFYTNYDHISKAVLSDGNTNVDANVFDYLHDNECIELIDKNKYCQSIVHWSLCENDEYIFNAYEGFSGLFIEKDGDSENIYVNDHNYGNTPNTVMRKADKNQNSTGWITQINVSSWNSFYKYIQNVDKYKKNGTLVGNSKFVNGVKYEFVPEFEEGLYVIGMVMPSKLLTSVTSSIECCNVYDRSVYAILKNDMLLILTDNADNIAFGSMYDILHVLNNNSFTSIADNEIREVFRSIYLMMNSKVDPEMIVFSGSILYGAAAGPSKSVSEVTYYKDNDTHNYIMRYDGRIKPAFVSNGNNIYYKDYISDGNDSKLKKSCYAKYAMYEYEPSYPSIGFCPIRSLSDWKYDALPMIHVSEHMVPVSPYSTMIEYNWFEDCRCMILKPCLNFTQVITKNADDTYLNIDCIIDKCIKDYYEIDGDTLNYVKSLYSYRNDWEYYSDTNIDDYIYNITLSLK